MSIADKATPAIGAIAPWFGSKRNLAPTIVEEVGDHGVYWEPFCGSLAVLLAKPLCLMEAACDLHGDLINLAITLKVEETAIDLYGRLSRTTFHEGLFDKAADRCRARGPTPATETADVNRAEDFMISSWFGRNGMSGARDYNVSFCVRFTANGGQPAKRWRSVVESIPWWHDRLRNVTILNRDAFEVLACIDDVAGTAIYIDPPYLVKGAKYVHDFESADHARLAELLRRFQKARVIVSYYAHPELSRLYPGWTVRQIEVTKGLASQGLRGKSEKPVKATEVLLINGSSRAEPRRERNLFGEDD